ncbi:MAG: 5'-nucleotidase C-terminal domain-containing protein [Bacteroidales bacterium]|jgi:2',3'-cyclic-nucleotide 2'-phosphodiesterase/3'-nucleotidase|nr:5'-nucleotidase C-terminal domain-containing protein [Bacteroidales bacterium]
MRSLLSIVFVSILILFYSCTSTPGAELDIYVTTDLHGMVLPFNNTEGEETDRSLANLASLVESASEENIILLDNGDILQGDPLTYYYNFVDTARTHVIADMLNHLGYDAATAGNHDIEAGHPVYDRLRSQYKFPLLAANAVSTTTGEPYFTPYTVIRKSGLKVVVFGLITPSVPDWLPEALYSGIRFDGMVETAQKWMPEILREKPDLIVGLFHSGVGDDNETAMDENSSLSVAVNVPGFDIIFCGHDHNQAVKKAINTAGDTVLLLDGGSRAAVLMHVNISLSRMPDGTSLKRVEGDLIPMNSLPASLSFIERYNGVSDTIKAYASEVIGRSDASVTSRDAFFGPSAFVDLIHDIQLEISGADISFAAPLSYDEQISEGDLRIRDMFRLYRFENFLYTLSMTGTEVDRYLEHSYGLWFNTMNFKNDLMLRYSLNGEGKPIIVNGRPRLRNPSYNFDSAMGIRYVVDVTKPQGARVTITSLSDGTAFSGDMTYRVAVNSYRANGGGGHIEAAGLSKDEMEERIISSTPRDLRFYMTEWIRHKGEISPVPQSQWTLNPVKWTSAAAERERKMLFQEN